MSEAKRKYEALKAELLAQILGTEEGPKVEPGLPKAEPMPSQPMQPFLRPVPLREPTVEELHRKAKAAAERAWRAEVDRLDRLRPLERLEELKAKLKAAPSKEMRDRISALIERTEAEWGEWLAYRQAAMDRQWELNKSAARRARELDSNYHPYNRAFGER